MLWLFLTLHCAAFCWYHIFTPRREKVYKVNVEHDACIGVRVWFVLCITSELEFKVAVKIDVRSKES